MARKNLEPRRGAVLAALQKHGPMTRYELAEHLDWPVRTVGQTLSSTRFLLPGQLLRIVSYEQGVRVVARFAAEAGSDEPLPRINKKRRERQKAARWREKNRAVISAKGRIYKANMTGREVAVNPWIGLAPATVRSAMARVHREEAGRQQACS